MLSLAKGRALKLKKMFDGVSPSLAPMARRLNGDDTGPAMLPEALVHSQREIAAFRRPLLARGSLRAHNCSRGLHPLGIWCIP